MPENSKVEPVITRGNVYSMITTAIGVAGVIISIAVSYTTTSKDVESNRSEITTMKAGLEQARASIRQLEISEARTAERYNSILTNVDEIKLQLREVTEYLRQAQRDNNNGNMP